MRRIVAAGVLTLADVVWLVIGLFHEYRHPLLGWLPLAGIALLAGDACLRVARDQRFDDSVRRFWRGMTVACGLFLGGIVSNAYDALGSGEPSQHVGPVTTLWYLSVLAVVLTALLRLPSWGRTRADWLRFGLDACVVVVTSGVFCWHFTVRQHAVWMQETGSAGPMLAIVAVTCVSLVTFVKVAFAGAGRLDRGAVRWLIVTCAVSSAAGSLTPFLTAYPYLSASFLAVSLGVFGVHLSAYRQLRGRSTEAVPRRRTRRISVVPYVAVAAADALLLASGVENHREVQIMQAVAVVLTALVMMRQILALRDNHELQAALRHQATHDRLTGVGNRALFEQRVAGLLSASESFHVVLLDLDDFKVINDRHGHGTGDRLLTAVSERLTRAAADGTVVRLGGDEFVLVLTAGDPAGTLDAVLAGLREVAAASVGVTASRPGDTPEELLRRSDVAMYEAKSLGGNRWRWFDPAMDEKAAATARLDADLRQALERGEMFPLYQPIVELPAGRPIGAEVLLRWRHAELGLVGPDVFIPLAERSGFIVELGRWVLEQACRQAAQWQASGAMDGRISVNVSARQLAEPGFVAEVEEIVSRTGADRTRLLLEVTETAVLGAGLAAVHELRARGLRVALDDFGTGQSSLSLLMDCPVDVLKVDKSFVSGAAAGAAAAAVIVENLIGFATGLRMEAVAEGVETVEQADRLHAAGYRMAQGYLYGRPMPAAEIEAAFREPALS